MGREWILLLGDWLGGVEWIQLAQDRDRWRAVVNTVMKLLVLAPEVSSNVTCEAETTSLNNLRTWDTRRSGHEIRKILLHHFSGGTEENTGDKKPLFSIVGRGIESDAYRILNISGSTLKPSACTRECLCPIQSRCKLSRLVCCCEISP
jgi:hypothetical protein